MDAATLARGLDPAGLRAGHKDLLGAVVKQIATAARPETPVATGKLRRSLGTKVFASGLGAVVKTTRYYAFFVHEGTRPHLIRPKYRRVLVFHVMGRGRVTTRLVHHPGSRPKPFLDLGLAASTQTIDKLMTEAGEEFFTRVARGGGLRV